ncbi:hypothetical protein ACHQM5_008784 [Ranunculus cassubicifolius]
METPQEYHQHSHQTQENSSGSSSSTTGTPNKTSYQSRPSPTRWTPTSEQIRILKELYYDNGVRSPNAEQIHRISARLRQYGKIEGKSVFYWFQNHKARDRMKKRFALESMQRAASNPPEYIQHYPLPHVRYITTSPGDSSPSPTSSSSVSGGVLGVGQMGNGSLLVERSLRDCSIYSSGSGMSNMNVAWARGVEPRQFRARNDEHHSSRVIETLPLFPMHDEETPIGDDSSFSSNNESTRGSPTSSLELSLSSGGQWNS